jgi:hypothetical protein
MPEIDPLQPPNIRSPGSKRKLFFVNVCIPILTIIFMLLSAIIIVIRQSIMNSDFLELIAEKIQEKIYAHFGVFDKEELCMQEQAFYEGPHTCYNMSSRKYNKYIAWLDHMCQ